MKVGVVTFPGSNCDDDCLFVWQEILQQPVVSLWHDEDQLPKLDLVILPGGFSYGDYLRAGAIARFAKIMRALKKQVQAKRGFVLGICNGFQILIEAGLLPGVLIRNSQLRFACKSVQLRVENAETALTTLCSSGQILTMPIAHGEGNYFIKEKDLQAVEARGQILFRYVNREGEAVPEANPNGSVSNIAGVSDRSGRVFGLMPHPERASEFLLGSVDGKILFDSLVKTIQKRR